jgi:hypothetical protein
VNVRRMKWRNHVPVATNALASSLLGDMLLGDIL